MTGHLDLVCAADENGRSFLRQQSFNAPLHISKSFLDEEETLVVNVVNPTAGFFAGDRVRCGVRVESGARLLLTSPSANRVHRMIAGEAHVEQNFSVASGGSLEVWPELFIPQGGARYRQKTHIEVEAGGELLFFETFAPGRVASGEVFQFESLDFETDIFYAGEKVVRERHRLSPATESLRALQTHFAQAYYAGCFCLNECITSDAPCWKQIDALHGDDVWVGCSRLAGCGAVIKIQARDAIALRRCVQEIRCMLYAGMNRRAPAARKL